MSHPSATTLIDETQGIPLVEKALGVQFAADRSISSSQMVRFTASLLGEYPFTRSAPLMTSIEERFGDAVGRIPINEVRLDFTPPDKNRWQLMTDDESTMVQVQENRLHVNWRVQPDLPHESFEDGLHRFLHTYGSLLDILEKEPPHGAGAAPQPPVPVFWEVLYINHVRPGPAWSRPADWVAVFPGLYGMSSPPSGCEIETASAKLTLLISAIPGRVRVEASPAYAGDGVSESPIFFLSLTARGPIPSPGTKESIAKCLRAGHDAIIETFRLLPQPDVAKRWMNIP
jgi:uncharacterized protein (TIGR04255 family)